MKQIILSIRRIWTKAVFWFAYFFRIEYKTANTTLLVAIVPAIIAVSRGITYLWLCFYYGYYFNIPGSLIQNTDSIWISFFRFVLCVLEAACGFLGWMQFTIDEADDDSLPSITLSCFFLCNLIVVGVPVALPPVLSWILKISSSEVFQIARAIFPYCCSLFVGTGIAAAQYCLKTRTETFVKIFVKIFTFGITLIMLGSLFDIATSRPTFTLNTTYPITENEAGKPAVIVYLTNETAVLEEVEIKQYDDIFRILIIHKNKQEIPSSITALTYEYQTFNSVEIEP